MAGFLLNRDNCFIGLKHITINKKLHFINLTDNIMKIYSEKYKIEKER